MGIFSCNNYCIPSGVFILVKACFIFHDGDYVLITDNSLHVPYSSEKKMELASEPPSLLLRFHVELTSLKDF